jgi:hypothetical protein
MGSIRKRHRFRSRRQPKPKSRLVLFLLTFGLWCLIACLGTLLYYGLKYRDFGMTWSWIHREHGRVALASGVLFGGLPGLIHYWLIRFRSKEPGRRPGWGELAIVVTIVVALGAGSGFFLHVKHRNERIARACWGATTSETLEQLLANGEIADLVRRMEADCRTYQAVRKEGIPEEIRNRYSRFGGNGMGYYLCTIGQGWETLELNMPTNVGRFLDSGPSLGSPPGGLLRKPEEWRPLGLEMAKSEVGILRVLGHWLLQDAESFAVETYKLADGGDATFLPLARLVCLYRDPNLQRVIQRLLASRPWPAKPEKREPGVFEDDRLRRIYTASRRVVYEGHPADGIPAEIRDDLRRFFKEPEFVKYSRSAYWGSYDDHRRELTLKLKSADAEAFVRTMESACRNLEKSREILGEQFPILTEELTHGERNVQTWNWILANGSQTLVLNLPMGAAWVLFQLHDSSKSKRYSCPRQYKNLEWPGGIHLAAPAQGLPVANRMSQSTVPIVRVLGWLFLRDMERFATETYAIYHGGDETFRALSEEVSLRLDPDIPRSLQRLLAGPFPPTLTGAEREGRSEADRLNAIFRLAYLAAITGDDIGDDTYALRPVLRHFAGNEKRPEDLANIYNCWVRLRLNNLVEAGDIDSALGLIENACRNHLVNRKKLEEDFLPLVESGRILLFPHSDGNPVGVGRGKETFYLNMPLSVLDFIFDSTFVSSNSDYFARSFPDNHVYRTSKGEPMLRNPEKMGQLARKMSGSEIPIVKAMGYYLLGDRPRFIETVYQTREAGDETFESLRRVVAETMDPNFK